LSFTPRCRARIGSGPAKPVLGALALIALVGCSSGASTRAVIGRAAPSIAGMGLDGRDVALADDRGHPVLVNFWASWCIPCRDEFPVLRQALTDHPGLRVFGVAFQDAAAPARDFAGQAGATWPSIVDRKDHQAAIWSVRAPPVTVLVGPDGAVRARHVGQLSRTELERMLSGLPA
jgi:cytochrome c biogenesis protein CcmG/thiol:disulfide interchange protein DsbE